MSGTSEPIFIKALSVGTTTTIVTSTTEVVSSSEPVDPLRLWNQIASVPSDPVAFGAAFTTPAADDDVFAGVVQFRRCTLIGADRGAFTYEIQFSVSDQLRIIPT